MDNVELGKRIKELRKSRSLKQGDLSALLGISRGQISNLEHGRRSLNLKQLEKLCAFFKVDMEYFGISPTAEESIALIERAKLIFESDNIPTKTKDELHLILIQVYLNSKKE